MKVVADEGVDGPIVARLRQDGHEVVYIAEMDSGIDDDRVLWQVSAKDQAGNAHVGDVLATDSRNTLVHATSRLVSLVGVDNLVVIETPDAVLVADRARSQTLDTGIRAL